MPGRWAESKIRTMVCLHIENRETKKTVEDYTSPELEIFQDQFLPMVEQYKQRGELSRKLNYVVFGCFISTVILAGFYPKTFLPAGFLLLAAIAALIVSLVRFVNLWPHCPACAHAVENIAGPYCPKCGAKGLTRSFLTDTPGCQSCRTRLSQGKRGRKFRIRYCNRCGIPLYDPGI